MGPNGGEASAEVEEEEDQVAEPVFDVATEDPEVEHVAKEVQPTAVEEHGGEGGAPGGDRRGDIGVEDADVASLPDQETPFGDFGPAGQFAGNESPLQEENGDVYVVGEEERTAKVEFVEENQDVHGDKAVGDVGYGLTLNSYVAYGDQGLLSYGRGVLAATGEGRFANRPYQRGDDTDGGCFHSKMTRGLRIQAVEDFEKLAILGHSALEVSDDAVTVDDEDGALDALAVGFDGIVGVGHGAVGVGQEGEGKVELSFVVLVRFHRGGVDGEDRRAGCVEFGPVVPQGLELAVSTGGVVATVEYEEDVLLALVAA